REVYPVGGMVCELGEYGAARPGEFRIFQHHIAWIEYRREYALRALIGGKVSVLIEFLVEIVQAGQPVDALVDAAAQTQLLRQQRLPRLLGLKVPSVSVRGEVVPIVRIDVVVAGDGCEFRAAHVVIERQRSAAAVVRRWDFLRVEYDVAPGAVIRYSETQIAVAVAEGLEPQDRLEIRRRRRAQRDPARYFLRVIRVLTERRVTEKPVAGLVPQRDSRKNIIGDRPAHAGAHLVRAEFARPCVEPAAEIGARQPGNDADRSAFGIASE